MSPTSIRRTALQPTTGTPITDLDQKKDQARARVKNIAIGVIVGLSLATAAYYGNGLIFGGKTTKPSFSSKVCELGFISTKGIAKSFSNEGGSTNVKVIDVGPGSEFAKAHAALLTSKEHQECVKDFEEKTPSTIFNTPCHETTKDTKGLDEYYKCQERMKKAPSEFLSKYCETNPTHWLCV